MFRPHLMILKKGVFCWYYEDEFKGNAIVFASTITGNAVESG